MGPFGRDIKEAFTDGSGRCVLTKSAASELTERLGADYQAFAARDLAEFKALYLFVDGIAERLHRTMLDEFYRVAFRKKIYRSIGELQTDLDVSLEDYNLRRSHPGRWCFAKTPMQTFLDARPISQEKQMTV